MSQPIVVTPRGPRWEGYLVTRSAILHGGADRLGNVIPFATEPLTVPGRGTLEVPTVSGNSIRHQLREALAHLYLRLLQPLRVPPKLYYMLFSGGANQGGDGGHFDFDDRRRVAEMIPPIAVFGTARDGGTFAGCVGVASAQPIARETWDVLRPLRPTAAWPCGPQAAEALGARVWAQRSASSLRMLAEKQYTRVDALRVRAPDYVLGGVEGGLALEPVAEDERRSTKRGAKEGSPQQMIYSAQVLVRGVALHHAVYFTQPETPLTLAAFGAALGTWAEVATIGGRAAVGHGLVDVFYDQPLPDAGPFIAYVRERRDAIRRYLADQHGANLDPYERPAEATG